MKMIKWSGSIVAGMLVFVSVAWSHDCWIMPDSFRPNASAVIEASFTSSHTHFKSEEVPDITKYRLCMITPRNREVPLAFSAVETQAARFAVPLAGPGTYVLSAASTASQYWCKTTDGWKTGRKSEHQNVLRAGRYEKSVKSFITVDKPTDSYKMQVGQTIELIPQANPCALKAGQTLPVLVLFAGQPLPDTPVVGIYEGYQAKDHADQPVKTKTSGKGIAAVKLDRPGKWLVYAKHEIETPHSPYADYENYRSYMMFEME